jgi:hypothetical protein
MTSAVSSAAPALQAQALDADKVLGAVKQAHTLAGCRTCGLMALFAPVEPGKQSA